MKSSPTQDGGKCEEEKHRVEQNEPGNGGVGVLEEDHHRHKPHCWPPEVQFSRGIIGQRYTQCPEGGIEHAHKGVVDFRRVRVTGFELERPVVSCQVTRESNKHLAEWRVHIEIELALEIVGTEFTKAMVDRVSEGPWF